MFKEIAQVITTTMEGTTTFYEYNVKRFSISKDAVN